MVGAPSPIPDIAREFPRPNTGTWSARGRARASSQLAPPSRGGGRSVARKFTTLFSKLDRKSALRERAAAVRNNPVIPPDVRLSWTRSALVETVVIHGVEEILLTFISACRHSGVLGRSNNSPMQSSIFHPAGSGPYCTSSRVGTCEEARCRRRSEPF